MVGRGPLEVAKTVLEVADVAWTAMECCHHHQHHSNNHHDLHELALPLDSSSDHERGVDEEKLEALRAENQRLRNLLEQNLNLLQNISESSLSLDCPPDVILLLFICLIIHPYPIMFCFFTYHWTFFPLLFFFFLASCSSYVCREFYQFLE